ncbi:MAG: helix-hairpin-helix domain-containing protein, partial [Actinomycetes bacterium]
EAADQSSVNLARVLSDGEQIIVAKIGENSNSAAAGGFNGASALINLNRASASELDALPGIGPAIAARITDWRVANGGFKKKEDLMQVKGIGQKLFAQIKDQVTF